MDVVPSRHFPAAQRIVRSDLHRSFGPDTVGVLFCVPAHSILVQAIVVSALRHSGSISGVGVVADGARKSGEAQRGVGSACSVASPSPKMRDHTELEPSNTD